MQLTRAGEIQIVVDRDSTITHPRHRGGPRRRSNRMVGGRPFTQQDTWVPPAAEIIDRDLAYSWFSDRADRVRPATEDCIPSLCPRDEDPIPEELGTQEKGDRIGAWEVFASAAQDPSEMVDRFVTIKTDRDVLAFARRFGVLDLCVHGRPSTHLGLVRLCSGRQDARWNYELLERWHHYVALMKALLSIAVAIHDRRAGSAQNWETINNSRPKNKRGRFPPANRLIENVSTAQLYLLEELEELILLGGVHPAPEWRPGEAVGIRHKGNALGLMALQILVAVGGAHAYAICNHCGTSFNRAKKGKPGQRSWCPECRATVSNRQRQRDHRERKSEKERIDGPSRS